MQLVTERIAQLCKLGKNWDSYGAEPISAACLQVGILLIRALLERGAPTPHIVPTPSGGLQFEWFLADRELEIEVISPSQLAYFYEDAEGESEGENASLTQLYELVSKLTA